jgi:hypothetical protein
MYDKAFLDELRARLPVSAVAGRKVKLKKEGRLWVGLSPFNKEKTPSFKCDDDKQSWHCYSSGRHGDIFAFVTLTTGCDFRAAVEDCAAQAGMPLSEQAARKPNGNGQHASEPPPHPGINGGGANYANAKAKREITATYDYPDSDGAVIYQTCRQEWIDNGSRRKTFLQRRPGPDGEWAWGLAAGVYLKSKSNGQWYQATKDRLAQWKGAQQSELPDIAHTLYRMDEIAAERAFDPEERRTLWIPEGEKDCETLRAWGLLATTNSGGASNWKPHFAEYLTGFDCVVLLDNDTAGRQRGHVVASALLPFASRVRVLSWPEHWPACPDHGDVTDWRDKAGGDLEKISDIAWRLADWTPPLDSKSPAIATAQNEGPTPDDYAAAMDEKPALPEGVSINDFRAYMPTPHGYIYTPTRSMWPAASVNARIPPVPIFDAHGEAVLNKKGEQATMAASAWLDRNSPVEQLTWVPGEPMLIRNRYIEDGGWTDHPGGTCFNLYKPAAIIPGGDPAKAQPWLDHARKLFGDDAGHIIFWLAHRVQRPAEKINHALVLTGNQGIGKDTLLEPVKRTIGNWNFQDVTPQQILGRFTGFLRSVILRVSEARDLGDIDRFRFYDHMKAYTAAPPDVLRVDEKNLREYAIPNVTGVIITTNHKCDGIFLPADDRRHFVTSSELSKEQIGQDYWNGLWRWYADGGFAHVGAYLRELDLSAFDPKAPPPKTQAFWNIVDAGRAPEDAELADVLDRIGNPHAVTIARITAAATGDFLTWIQDRKNRRAIPHRLETAGYVPVRNDAAKDGLWMINDKRQAVYARSDLPIKDRLRAAQQITKNEDLPFR